MKIGDADVRAILDAVVDVDPAFLYAEGFNASRHTATLTEVGQMRMTIGGFLLRVAGRTILVDAGNGLPALTPHYGHLLESLVAAGTTPEEITDVVVTHLHMDHVGWVSDGVTATFPNATYWVHQADLAHFHDPANDHPGIPVTANQRLQPLGDRLHPVSEDTFIAPGVELRHAGGHTPGSVVVVLTSNGQRLLLLGDVIHHPAELIDPTWRFTGDVDVPGADAARHTWIAEAHQPNTLTTAAHFPGMAIGVVRTVGAEDRWEPVETITVPPGARASDFAADGAHA